MQMNNEAMNVERETYRYIKKACVFTSKDELSNTFTRTRNGYKYERRVLGFVTVQQSRYVETRTHGTEYS